MWNKAQALTDRPEIAALSGPLRQDLQALCRVATYAAGQTIVEVDTPSPIVGIVRQGILRMQKTHPDGRQQVVGLLIEGDMFGRVFDGPFHFALEAATDCEIYAFPKAPLEALLQRSPELNRVFLLNLLHELDRARDWMILLANPRVRGRLAGFFLLLCAQYHADDQVLSTVDRAIRVRIPISRLDLANLLGARPESISRALHAMADDGLIKIVRPDLIVMSRLDALSEEAGETNLIDPGLLRRLARTPRRACD